MQPPPLYAQPLELEICLKPGMTTPDVGNAVYKLAQPIYEAFGECDPASGIAGNGHHIAQKLIGIAEAEWAAHGGRSKRPVVEPLPLAREIPFHLSILPLKITVYPGVSATRVESDFYALMVKIFEAYGERDPESGFKGNGHHAAQNVATTARKLWIEHGGRADPKPE